MRREAREARQELHLPVVPEHPRPETRGDCLLGARPCPFVGCRHHLFLGVSPKTGTIKLNFPDLEPWELQHSCSLDVADAGGMRLEDVGVLMNVTRERARQLEAQAFAHCEEAAPHLKAEFSSTEDWS